MKENTIISGEQLAIACARVADAMKAEDVLLFELKGLSSLTDYMIVCSGNSMPHLKAVMREVSAELLEKHGAKPTYTDGNAEARWVVLDFVDVMVHIMHEEVRETYGLEELWGDAKLISWEA